MPRARGVCEAMRPMTTAVLLVFLGALTRLVPHPPNMVALGAIALYALLGRRERVAPAQKMRWTGRALRGIWLGICQRSVTMALRLPDFCLVNSWRKYTTVQIIVTTKTRTK